MSVPCVTDRRIRRLVLFVFVAGGLATVPIDPTLAQAPTPSVDIDRAERAWRSLAPDDYTITIVVSGFFPGSGRPVSYRVADGKVTILGPAMEPVAFAAYERYNSVDRLFEAIRRVQSGRPARLDVVFHPELGYPVSIDVDFIRDAIDDEEHVKVLDLRTGNPQPGRSPFAGPPVRPGQPTPSSVPSGQLPSVLSSGSAMGVVMRVDARPGLVSDFAATVPALETGGRCEAFPGGAGPGQRALFYGFGPVNRPTRRIMVVLDERGNVIRYSDGRGDLRAPADPSVTAHDPLGPRTTISIDWAAQSGVFLNAQGSEPASGILARGPDVLVASSLGFPAQMVATITSACGVR